MKTKKLGVGINTEHIRTDGIDFIGKKIDGAAELASLLQTFRNPLYETFRIFYMKDDYVIAAEAISNRLPGCVNFAEDGDAKKAYLHTKEIMEALKADSFYICHNHPSGDPSPSAHDRFVTMAYDVFCEGFLGHIVLDHTKFALIDKYGHDEILDVPNCLPKDPFLSPTIEHPLLGTRLESISEAAELGRKLIDCSQTDVSLQIFTDVRGNIRAIEEISSHLLQNIELYKDFLEKRVAEYGGCCSFLITADANMHSNFDILIEEKYLTDSICVDEFGFYWSRLEDNGVRPIPGFEICGKKEDELDIFRDIQYGNSIDEETIKNIEKYDPDIEI